MKRQDREPSQMELGREIDAFRESCRTIYLATVDGNGNPHVSYAPFALTDGGYYILISRMARHAGNLLGNPRVSFMLIEDESASKVIHARKRLTFDANAIPIERGTERWRQGFERLESRFGGIIGGLGNLEDFEMFRLEPAEGLFVKGFGQAFRVGVDDSADPA